MIADANDWIPPDPDWNSADLDDRMLARIEQEIDARNRRLAKLGNLCPVCHGSCLADCGGFQIGCTACGAGGTWSDYMECTGDID